MRRRLIVTLMTVLAMFAALTFGAGGVRTAEAATATEIVKTKQAALFDLIKKPPSPANQKSISAIFDEMLDYGLLAEASLGSEWAARSDVEKKEFSDLLKQLVRKAYERNLKKTLNFDINYVGEDASGAVKLVKTRAVSRVSTRDEPIEIDFAMHERNGTWQVGDIVTEGVSLVSSYRSQFTKTIRKEGFTALIKKMKDKLAKGDV